MQTKRGQAAGAAVLLAIIAGLIIMFIILVPPSEREKLLGTDDSVPEREEGLPSFKVLLRESPGRLDFLDKKEVEHPLPVINVFTKEESQVLAKKNLARVSNKAFSELTSDFSFFIQDLSTVDNVLLSFTIGEFNQGNLIILLNGEEIYNSPAVSGAVQPIVIPNNALQNSNVMVFSVSSPGLEFWKTNEITVRDIRLIADVLNLRAQQSRNLFLVTETEKSNLESVLLQFQPNCRIQDVAKLRIQLNGKELYNAVPDCEVQMIPLELSPLDINQGENELVFSAERGTYQLSHVKVKSFLKAVDYPTYYFDLSLEQYRAVQNNNRKLIISFNFVDVTSQKIADVIFNGRVRHLDTARVSEKMDVSIDVVQGTNAVKIKPRQTLEIRELKASLE